MTFFKTFVVCLTLYISGLYNEASANDFILCQQQQSIPQSLQKSCFTVAQKTNFPAKEIKAPENNGSLFTNKPDTHFPRHTHHGLFSKSIHLPIKENIAKAMPNTNT